MLTDIINVITHTHTHTHIPKFYFNHLFHTHGQIILSRLVGRQVNLSILMFIMHLVILLTHLKGKPNNMG
jgi:hypothetical protein